MQLDINIITGILLIAATAAAGFVYVRGGYTKSSIEFLRGRVKDLQDAFDACKKDRDEDKKAHEVERIAIAKAREEDRLAIADLKGQVSAMEKLLRRIPEINGKKK